MAAGAASWITASRSFLGSMSAGDAEKLAHANASRLYRLPF
jgi:predicted TIM-barrel fold metal-dependent hydrolase